MNCTASTSDYSAYGTTGATLLLPPLCFSLSRLLTVVEHDDGDHGRPRLRDDVAQWCEDCIGPVRFEHAEVAVCLTADVGARKGRDGALMAWGEYHRLLHFECEVDMVAFKLRWE